MNPADMVAALRVPAAKLQKREMDSAEQRVVTLKTLLGDATPDIATIQQALLDGFAEGLGIEPVWGDVTENEEELARKLFDEEIGTDEFVHEIDDPGADTDFLSASYTCPGGTVSCFLRLEGSGVPRIREVLFTGDFFVTPPRIVYDLEASLRGVSVLESGAAVEKFFAQAPVDLLTIQPADFRGVLEDAIGYQT
jgi:lipoate-protein ligase A